MATKLALSLATVIFSSFGQAENIVNSPFSFRSIAVSDFGREISVSTEQVANAPEPMWVTPSGMVRLESLRQDANAFAPMSVRRAGS